MSYSTGDYFGEIALLREDSIRAASIYAEVNYKYIKTDLTLFKLDKNGF